MEDHMTKFITSRYFAATPSTLFNAIKDQACLATWWGPKGFSNRIEVFEFYPGGRWVFDMVGPDGTTYPNEALFSDIETDRKVVIQHTCHPHFELSITLEPKGEGTLLWWEQAFADPVVAQAMQAIAEPANEQNLDRLGQALGLNPAPG
jgi:uncharacterized protein YndB with AHSA1/START domain